MNTRKLLGLLPVFALTATLAACGGSPTEGKPNPQANTSEQPSDGAPQKLLAPPVPEPLKFKPFLSKEQICKILNANQAKQLGMEQPQISSEPTASGLIVSCGYKDRGSSDIGIGVTFNRQNPGGLSDIYRQKSQQKAWEPLAIDSYPAVIVRQIDKNKHSGSCEMYLGVTNQQVMFFDLSGGYDMDKGAACEKTKQAAGMVISNLKLQR